MKRKQYRKHTIKISTDEDGNYYGMIYNPQGDYITYTLPRNDIPSVIAQAESIIDENIKKSA
jgi:hypothetical protein